MIERQRLARLKFVTSVSAMAVVFLVTCACYSVGCHAAAKSADGSERKMSVVDIVPGKSIGTIRIGTRTSDLPTGARVADSAGEFDGIRFSLGAGIVNDVWIDDIRTFPHEIRLSGRPLNPRASLEEIKTILGPCDRVEGVKGGTFFNCRNGMAIGTDPEESGAFVQLRLQHR